METEHNHNECNDEAWDCPTCGRPTPPEHDHRCSTCDMFASQHISVTSLCRLLREAIAREDKLVIKVEKLKAQLAEKETFIQRVITWPHDADPFTSPDHDNDRHYP